MAEAAIGNTPWSMWYKIRIFINTHLVNIFAGGLFVLLAIFLVFPLVMVFLKSFWGDDGFTTTFYQEFFTYNYYYWSFLNTMILGLSTMFILVVVGFCFAYMTTRGPMWLRTPLKICALMPLCAPPYIFSISLITLFGRNGMINNFFGLDFNIYSWTGVIAAQALAFLPLSFMMIENVLNSQNPSLEESASDMGASEMQIIRSITIPLASPGILKAALLVFVMTIAEFGNPAILGGRIPFLAPDTYLMITGEGDFNMASVLSVVLMVPCLIIFVLHNYILKGKGYTTIVGKPTAVDPKEITPVIKTFLLAVITPVVIMVVLCFAVIFIGAFVKIVGVDNTFVWDHMLNMQSNEAIYNSVKLSLMAGLFGAIVGTLLAYVIMRGKFKGRHVMEMMALSGFALPGTVIGVGYIMAFNKPPFLLAGTIWILILNCAFRFLAVGVEAGISKLHQISIEIEEASADLGADFITVFIKVILPIMFSAFVAGFIYTFMTTMMSLSSVIFLVKMIFIVLVCLASLKLLAKKTGLKSEKK